MTNTADGDVKFDKILGLEQEVRVCNARAAFAPTDVERERAVVRKKSAQRRLYAAIDALTGDELAAFGRYRSAG